MVREPALSLAHAAVDARDVHERECRCLPVARASFQRHLHEGDYVTAGTAVARATYHRRNPGSPIPSHRAAQAAALTLRRPRSTTAGDTGVTNLALKLASAVLLKLAHPSVHLIGVRSLIKHPHPRLFDRRVSFGKARTAPVAARPKAATREAGLQLTKKPPFCWPSSVSSCDAFIRFDTFESTLLSASVLDSELVRGRPTFHRPAAAAELRVSAGSLAMSCGSQLPKAIP